jgi:hypothetical protein
MSKKIILSAVLIMICFSIISCSKNNNDNENIVNNMTTQQLIEIIKNESNSEYYDLAIAELGNRPQDGHIIGPILAYAQQQKRRDYYLAAISLSRLGKEGNSGLPELLIAMDSESSEIKSYAIYSISFLGDNAKCSIPELAKYLWDPNGMVRGTSAGAIEKITGLDLVETYHELSIDRAYGLPIDEPDGIITKKARNWWNTKGEKIEWPIVCVND